MVIQNRFAPLTWNASWFWLAKGSEARLIRIEDGGTKEISKVTFAKEVDLSSGSSDLSADGAFALIQAEGGYAVIHQSGRLVRERILAPAGLVTSRNGTTFLVESHAHRDSGSGRPDGGRVDVYKLD